MIGQLILIVLSNIAAIGGFVLGMRIIPKLRRRKRDERIQKTYDRFMNQLAFESNGLAEMIRNEALLVRQQQAIARKKAESETPHSALQTPSS